MRQIHYWLQFKLTLFDTTDDVPSLWKSEPQRPKMVRRIKWVPFNIDWHASSFKCRAATPWWVRSKAGRKISNVDFSHVITISDSRISSKLLFSPVQKSNFLGDKITTLEMKKLHKPYHQVWLLREMRRL